MSENINDHKRSPKVWKRPRQKRGFGQHQQKSILFCDDFAFIRDNTNYADILLNKKWIHNIENTRAAYNPSLNCVLIGLLF